MNVNEFSDAFDTVVNSYRRFKDFDKMEMLDSIEFSEYEKSLYLTQSQDEIVVGLYTGKNVYGEPFEDTEELRRYLEPLVKSAVCSRSTAQHIHVKASSVFFILPSDLWFIVYEQARIIDSALGCYDATETAVRPVTHDEYNRIKKNPFRGPTKYRVLRLDAGDGLVELVSDYAVQGYIIRYISEPSPIILEDITGEEISIKGKTTVTECALNPVLHDTILKHAVQLALASKGIQVNNNN